MNCKIAYMAYVVPIGKPHNRFDDIFQISKIHSSELIIFCFSLFLREKKIAKSAKKFLKDNYWLPGFIKTAKHWSDYLAR